LPNHNDESLGRVHGAMKSSRNACCAVVAESIATMQLPSTATTRY
jgi:hypothetical protein